MKLKSRNFPHPVLHPTTDDILDSFFVGKITGHTEEDTDIVFSIEFKLKNDTLNTLFQERSVHINVHFECKSTMQRLSYKVAPSDCSIEQSDKEYTYTNQISVKSNLLNKTIDVNYFILSNAILTNYSNNNMHSDFSGATFNIEKSDILALGVTQTIHLEKEELVSTASIFRINKDTSYSSPITIALNSNQIDIYVSEIIYERISHLKLYGTEINKILISMLYYPALLDVLHNIHLLHNSPQKDESDIDAYEALDWYRTLEKKIRNLGQDITNLNYQDFTSLAYNILYESADEPWTALEMILEGKDSEDIDE